MINMTATSPGVLRLLVVDRAAAFPDALEELAFELRCGMVVCRTMTDAFAELVQFKPHVVIVDPDVCELGAIGLVRAIGLAAPGCEVILTAVDGTSGVGLEAVKAGALECMTKRESLPRLREVLSRIAGNISRLERLMPREVDVTFRLDGKAALRHGRFTTVESRVT